MATFVLHRSLATLACFAVCGAAAQVNTDPAPLLAAQRDAMTRFAYMDGVWRGRAWTMRADGTKHEITQTERIGPFLGGSVRIMEGRGYEDSGQVSFNALGILSFDPARRSYNLRSYALGHSGDFALSPRDDGYVWEIPQGPMTIRYTARIGNGKWLEYGERIVAGREPARFFEMNLERVGDTDWPAGAPVPQR